MTAMVKPGHFEIAAWSTFKVSAHQTSRRVSGLWQGSADFLWGTTAGPACYRGNAVGSIRQSVDPSERYERRRYLATIALSTARGMSGFVDGSRRHGTSASVTGRHVPVPKRSGWRLPEDGTRALVCRS